MDDKKQPTTDKNINSDVPSAGDTNLPPTPPMPVDVPPPLPPLSPEEVKTPTQPLPKSEEKTIPTKDPLPNPDVDDKKSLKVDDVPVATQEENKSVTSETPIAPPEKKEMPVEAEFPGQPLPVEAQQNLEDKAKEMIDKDGGVKNRKVEVVGKPKGNIKKTLVGMLLFILVGGGAFAGMRLMGNTTENRSQAGVDPGFDCSKCDTYGSCKGDVKYVYCIDGDLIKENPKYGQCLKVCTENYTQIKCCDGTHITYEGKETDAGNTKACKGHGGWENCDDIKPDICTCESWKRVCGVKCRFPGGTGYAGQKKADSLCKNVIAMCNVSTGKVTYEVFEKGHKCWGEEDICNNPVYYSDCKEDPKVCNESCVQDSECDTGLSCDTVSNTCRNPICAESENCVCPEGDLICSDLTCSQPGLELGQSYTFTCNAQATGGKKIGVYEFQYQRNTGGWIDLPLSAPDSNVSSELFIENPGNYVVQCRVCEDKNDKTKCTPYQISDSH